MRGVRITPEADRVFMVGQTRKGKTTLARWLIEQMQPVRVIIFDPKEDFADGEWGVAAARTPMELAQAMHGPVVHFIPSSFEREPLEEACQIVWETPGPYIWLVDDASALTNPNYCPQGLMLACTQGAKQQKLVMIATQRVAASHPVLRSEATHVFVFVPPPIELDLKAIASTVRREAPVIKGALEQLQASHGDYSHLWYCLDGDELRACAPIPLEELAAGRQPPGAPGERPEDGSSQPEEGREPATQPASDLRE